MIKIALNGARSESPGVLIPNTPFRIKDDARKLFQSGFSIFHVHIYNDSGKESLQPDDVAKVINYIREISPYILIGISTGDWIEPNFEKRKMDIRNWKIIPDFASVNIIEENSIEVAQELIKKGIQVEAGITDPASAEKFVQSNINNNCLRILIEPQEQIFTEALSNVETIEKILDFGNIRIERLLHGFDETAWPLLLEAFKKGYRARIGLEDTIYLPSGKKAMGNLELAEAALKMA